MSHDSADVLENLLRVNDLGWMIDLYTPSDRAIPFLLELLDAVNAEYRRRIIRADRDADVLRQLQIRVQIRPEN